MPPKIRFAKDAVVRAAYEVTRTRGIDAVNARSVAAEIGCSTQPLFREFSSMEDIKEEVFHYAKDKYEQETEAEKQKESNPLKAQGRVYLRLASQDPNVFRLLFMRKRTEECSNFAIGRACDSATNLAKELNEDEAKTRDLYIHFWMFVHGMATMIATGYLSVSDKLIEEKLDSLLNRKWMDLPV